MPANTEPIYTLTPNIGFGLITGVNLAAVAANVSTSGSGVLSGGTIDMVLAFSAGANGSFVKEARIKAVGTTGLIANVATSIRLFLSSVDTGSATTANTHFITEVAIPAITGAANAASPDFIVPLNFAIPTGMYVLANSGIIPATNGGWKVSVIGGDY